jgi:hypothetical protein
MEYVLLILGLVLILWNGWSILPALPGVPVSWFELYLYYLIPNIKTNYWILQVTLV